MHLRLPSECECRWVIVHRPNCCSRALIDEDVNSFLVMLLLPAAIPLCRPDGAAGPCCGPATPNVAGIASESIGAPFASSVLLLLTLVPLLVFGLSFPPPAKERAVSASEFSEVSASFMAPGSGGAGVGAATRGCGCHSHCLRFISQLNWFAVQLKEVEGGDMRKFS